MSGVVCSGCVECIVVVFVVVDARRHGPAGCLGPGWHCCLGRGGGPGGVASRPWSATHSSQVEGQVLWGSLHHVLVVMLLELGLGFSPILKDKTIIALLYAKNRHILIGR